MYEVATMVKKLSFLKTTKTGKNYVQRHKVDMGGFVARYEELK